MSPVFESGAQSALASVLLFDVTRMLSRSHHRVPRGIDRVVLEYVLHFERIAHSRMVYCAYCAGTWWIVSGHLIRALIARLTRRWFGARHPMTWAARAVARAASDRRLRPAFWVIATRRLSETTLMAGDVTYINVSHKALTALAQLRADLPTRTVRIIVMIHDLMPLTSPRFFPLVLRQQFAAGMAAVSSSADLVIANSEETARDVGAVLEAGPSIVVLPLGVRTAAVPAAVRRGAVPMFACVGAIEARKNVELLLRVWERMVSTTAAPPRLILIGQASQDAALCRQIEGLYPHVSVRSGLDDVEVAELLSGARALLFPSWAEGFGLPLAEALAAGIPVVCSDLRALREVGGDLPEFLPPHDPDAWLATIEEYSGRSPRRQAQLERIREFRPPSWERHFEMLEDALSGLGRRDTAMPPPRPTL